MLSMYDIVDVHTPLTKNSQINHEIFLLPKRREDFNTLSQVYLMHGHTSQETKFSHKTAADYFHIHMASTQTVTLELVCSRLGENYIFKSKQQ